jgi:hypothetical protein
VAIDHVTQGGRETRPKGSGDRRARPKGRSCDDAPDAPDAAARELFASFAQEEVPEHIRALAETVDQALSRGRDGKAGSGDGPSGNRQPPRR